ncbi:MAG: site-specific integrase [Pseudonocardiaceae bacterium]
MGRPPLPVGTYGRIQVYPLTWGGFRARVRYRDYDGVTRHIERVGPTRTGAENNLKQALRDRARVSADGEITAQTKVNRLAELWLRDIDESDRAIRTKITYRDVWDRCLAASIGELRIGDVRVSGVDRVIREIRERRGPERARHSKIVLSGLFGLAVRHDALDANPVRELSRSRKKKSQLAVELTEENMAALRECLRASPDALKHDLIDLVDALSGLGCRIGELLALDWTKVDAEAGTLRIEGTVIRVPGAGLIVQPHTKSKAGMRTINPPGWVLDLFRRRHTGALGEWIFPSTRLTLRDPDNTRARLRDVVRGTPWEGLHPHAFRHLVATRLDQAGLSAREIADYLGHERISMTQDVYMSRQMTGVAAAAALDRLGPNESAG